MKPSTNKILFVIGCVCAITTATSFGQIYTFDELGNSTGPGISPGTLQPDPSGGLTVPVLVYNLSFGVVGGDVVLTEPPSASGPDSDIVRFWTVNGVSQIIFYSDFSTTDPPDAPADTGLPGSVLGSPVVIPEVGPEGNNGATYAPAPGAPGSSLAGVNVAYNIVSDGVVPEPGTLALAALGGGLLLAILKQRHPVH